LLQARELTKKQVNFLTA